MLAIKYISYAISTMGYIAVTTLLAVALYQTIKGELEEILSLVSSSCGILIISNALHYPLVCAYEKQQWQLIFWLFLGALDLLEIMALVIFATYTEEREINLAFLIFCFLGYLFIRILSLGRFCLFPERDELSWM